jgi:nucleoporin NUP159
VLFADDISAFRTPSLDSIDRTVRNISSATVAQIGELDELSLRVEELRVSGLFPAPHARRSPSIGEMSMSRTSSSLTSSAAEPAANGSETRGGTAAKIASEALRSEQSRKLLKETFLSIRKEPVFNQMATQSVQANGSSKWTENSSDLRQAFAEGPIVANKLALPRRSSDRGSENKPSSMMAAQGGSRSMATLMSGVPSPLFLPPTETGVVAPPSFTFGSSSSLFNSTPETQRLSPVSRSGGALRSNEKKRASSAVRLPPRDSSSPTPKPSSGFSFGALPPAPSPRSTVTGFRSFEGLQAPVPLTQPEPEADDDEEEEEEEEGEYSGEEEYEDSFGDEGPEDDDGFEQLSSIKEERSE